MTRGIWLWTAAPVALATVLAGPALAAPKALAAQTPAAAEAGVLIFQPAFFADNRPDTALDMINRLPGFGLDIGATNTRGLAGSAGNVLIDGARPSSKSDTLDQILRRIPASSVERVELIRGGAPGIDMEGRAVVANIVLKRQVQVQRTLETNAYFYTDGYIGPLINGQASRSDGERLIEGSFTATTDRTGGTAEGWRRRYAPDGALTQDADLDLWDHLQKLGGTAGLQQPFVGGKLRLNGLAEWEHTDNTQDVIVRSGVGPDEATVERSASLTGEVGGDWSRPLGPRTDLVLTGLKRWKRETYSGLSRIAADTSDFGNRATSGETIGRGVLKFRRNDRWAFESGAEAAYNYLDSTTTYAENGVATALPNAAVKVEELRGEAFSQTTWKATPRLNLEAGLRVEVSKISQTGDTNQSKSFVYPKPRVQLTWTPAKGQQVRLRVQRDVGQLDFAQFVASSEINLGSVQGGNADLEPQKSTVYELVFEQRFWDKGVLELIASHTDYQDVIDIIPLAGAFDGIGNIGDGTSDQFITRLTLPFDRLGLPGARLQTRFSWNTLRVTDPLTGRPRPFSNSQPFGCNISFNQDLAGGRWSYGVEHGCNVDESTRYRIRELRTSASEPFFTLWGQFKPSPGLTIRVEAGNVADAAQFSRRYLYDGARNVTALRRVEERYTRGGPWLYVQIRKAV